VPGSLHDTEHQDSRGGGLARPLPPSAGLARVLTGFLIGVWFAGCSGHALDSFPPPVRPGLEVFESNYRLTDAVQEYIDFRALPVSPDRMRSGVVTTEWFPVRDLERPPTPLARCPGTSPGAEADPTYRARYRFSILPRGGFRLLRAEAHWQREVEGGEGGTPAWEDCRSTGVWERETEDRILLRAKLLATRYRGG